MTRRNDYVVHVTENAAGGTHASVFGSAGEAVAFAAALCDVPAPLGVAPQSLQVGDHVVTYRGNGRVAVVRPLEPLASARRQESPVERVALAFNRWGQSVDTYERAGRLALVGLRNDGRFVVMGYDRRLGASDDPAVLTVYDTAAECAAWLATEGWTPRE